MSGTFCIDMLGFQPSLSPPLARRVRVRQGLLFCLNARITGNAMAEKRTKADNVLRRAERLDTIAEMRSELISEERRLRSIRSGEERRKADIPPLLGSPTRSGNERRLRDRRNES